MKILIIFLVLGLAAATRFEHKDIKIALDTHYGSCSYEHFIFGVVSDNLMSIPSVAEPVKNWVEAWKALLTTLRADRDVWVTAHTYNNLMWKEFKATISPFVMNHATPSHWETSHRAMSGLTVGNVCKALDFLSLHMNCNDNIHYMLLTYGTPTCNDQEIVEKFL